MLSNIFLLQVLAKASGRLIRAAPRSHTGLAPEVCSARSSLQSDGGLSALKRRWRRLIQFYCQTSPKSAITEQQAEASDITSPTISKNGAHPFPLFGLGPEWHTLLDHGRLTRTWHGLGCGSCQAGS